MKNLIYIFGIAGFIALAACDNSNRGIEDNQKADNNMMDKADTTAIQEEFNSRGVPAEGLPDNNAIRSDTLAISDRNAEMMEDLPEAVKENIMDDASLKTLTLTDSRRFTEDGTTYYELSFANGNKVIFDEQGNKTPGK